MIRTACTQPWVRVVRAETENGSRRCVREREGAKVSKMTRTADGGAVEAMTRSSSVSPGEEGGAARAVSRLPTAVEGRRQPLHTNQRRRV